MTDTTAQHTHLGAIVVGRREELQEGTWSRIRGGRTEWPNDEGDEFEHLAVTRSDDVEFALLGMKADALSRIDEALSRLDVGGGKCCVECGVAVSETRLRALPFAVRCQTCEGRRTQGQARSPRLGQWRASLSFFLQR